MGESPYLIQRRKAMFGTKPTEEDKQQTKPSLPRQKPLKKKSKKLQADHRKYVKIVKEMLAESNLCEMHTPDCIRIATGLQHKKRRGSNLLNKKYLIRSCDPCNNWVERHPKEALEMGLAISVHKIEKL